MKKLLSILLTASCVFGLCACGGNNAAPTETTEFKLPGGIMQKSDPAEDGELNVLLVGNSGCYYYVEELHGMLEAVGIKNRICNVYYSGCLLSQHYNWLQSGEANYEFFTTDENGRVKEENTNLEYCMRQRNWDVISLREGGAAKLRVGEAQILLNERKVYLDALFGYFREQYPLAKLYFEENGAFAQGYKGTLFSINTVEEQAEDTRHFREFTKLLAQTYEVDWVPKGEASQIYRETPGAVDDLCRRLAINNGEGDYYHDGDIGGGQYLTAGVWFELLTGQSIIGNTWRPDYELAEEKIQLLQQCAHKAVETYCK